jgi:hypothetical protein
MRSMHTPRRQLTTKHQRQRLVFWALTMLAWLASLLFAGRAPSHRQLRQRGRAMSLHGLTMLVKQLILLRAQGLAKLRRNKRRVFFKHGRDLKRRHLMRSILGSRLRRAFADRDPAKRIFALIDALRHLDAWAARFAKRLKCGFMRLWSIAPAPMPADALHGAPTPSPACADSS